MKQNRILFLFVLLLQLAACGKLQDCLSGGEETRLEITEIPYYDKLTLSDGIELILVTKQEIPLILAGEEHLISQITYTVTDSVLELKNTASCHWRHPKARLQAYLSPAGLKGITQKGYGSIRSADTLQIDHFSLQVLDGTGRVELTLKGKQLDVVSNGLANIYLSGKLNKLNAGFYYNDGQLHAENLYAGEVTLTHRGSNFMKVRPSRKLQAGVNSVGDLHCYGTPEEVQLEETDSGRLIYFD